MCSACRRRDGTTLQAGITRTTWRGCRFARGSIVFPLLCRAEASRDRHGSPNAPTRRRGARGGGSGEAVASAPGRDSQYPPACLCPCVASQAAAGPFRMRLWRGGQAPSKPRAHLTEGPITFQSGRIVCLHHRSHRLRIGYRDGKRQTVVQLDLLQKEPDRFRRRNADFREDALGRLLELRVDPGVNHLGLRSLLPHTYAPHNSVSQMRSRMLGRVLNRASAMGSFRSRATLEIDGLGRAPREEPHHTDGERADGRHLSRAGGSEYVPSIPGFPPRLSPSETVMSRIRSTSGIVRWLCVCCFAASAAFAADDL